MFAATVILYNHVALVEPKITLLDFAEKDLEVVSGAWG